MGSITVSIVYAASSTFRQTAEGLNLHLQHPPYLLISSEPVQTFTEKTTETFSQTYLKSTYLKSTVHTILKSSQRPAPSVTQRPTAFCNSVSEVLKLPSTRTSDTLRRGVTPNLPASKMDVIRELQRIVEEMEKGEQHSSLRATVDQPNPPPSPPSSPPPVFAGLGINTQLQSAERQGEEYGDFITLGADLHLPNLQPVNGVPTTAAVGHPAAAAAAAAAAAPPPQNISTTKVDVIEELEQIIEEMERAEPVPTLMETANNIFAGANAPNPPSPPPSLPPPVYAGLENITQPQLAERHCGCTPLGAIPHTVEQQSSWMAAPTMYAGPLPQGGSCSQSTCMVRPVHIARDRNGGVLYEVPEGHFAPVPVPAVPPLDTSSSKKRKREKEPHVKKPLNAFMLFLKEHRAKAGAELQGRGSAAINTVLGQIWNSLTKEEQAKYFRQAETERVLHAQRHPEWSPRQKEEEIEEQGSHQAPTRTEGQKEEEIEEQGSHQAPTRTEGQKEEEIEEQGSHQAPTRTEASASQRDESTQWAKKPCVTCMQTALMQTLWPLDVHTVLVPEAPHTQTVQVQQPSTQTAATVHVPVHHLPQLCEVSPAFTLVSSETASMSLASPAAPTKEEQAKYFHQAETARVLHAHRHPEWSPSDNFVSPTRSHTTHTLIHTE
ncbi:hypothetical protein ABVT39_028128 [Epinephelus coioides]